YETKALNSVLWGARHRAKVTKNIPTVETLLDKMHLIETKVIISTMLPANRIKYAQTAMLVSNTTGQRQNNRCLSTITLQSFRGLALASYLYNRKFWREQVVEQDDDGGKKDTATTTAINNSSSVNLDANVLTLEETATEEYIGRQKTVSQAIEQFCRTMLLDKSPAVSGAALKTSYRTVIPELEILELVDIPALRLLVSTLIRFRERKMRHKLSSTLWMRISPLNVYNVDSNAALRQWFGEDSGSDPSSAFLILSDQLEHYNDELRDDIQLVRRQPTKYMNPITRVFDDTKFTHDNGFKVFNFWNEGVYALRAPSMIDVLRYRIVYDTMQTLADEIEAKNTLCIDPTSGYKIPPRRRSAAAQMLGLPTGRDQTYSDEEMIKINQRAIEAEIGVLRVQLEEWGDVFAYSRNARGLEARAVELLPFYKRVREIGERGGIAWETDAEREGGPRATDPDRTLDNVLRLFVLSALVQLDCEELVPGVTFEWGRTEFRDTQTGRVISTEYRVYHTSILSIVDMPFYAYLISVYFRADLEAHLRAEPSGEILDEIRRSSSDIITYYNRIAQNGHTLNQMLMLTAQLFEFPEPEHPFHTIVRYVHARTIHAEYMLATVRRRMRENFLV
ncbi:hypothetical protein KDA14_04105, partial [Candidatus Saccharibacteria bacterium]|nr:hypothetical protein [Candidatus Saccharibacteria bacterium]